MTEILRVYREIYDPGVNYCVICLRSEHERRMVDIKKLEMFLKSINLPFNYCSDFQRLCWVCERRAASAYKFRLSVNLSASVHSLFVLMTQNVKTYNDTAKQLEGLKPQKGMVRSAAEWECRLDAVRSQSSMLHTEMLVVDTLPIVNYEPGEDEVCSVPSSPAATEEYLLPDEAPPPSPPPPSPSPQLPAPHPATRAASTERPDPLSEPVITMESIMLEEDDELDPIEIKHEECTPEEIVIEETPLPELMQATPPASLHDRDGSPNITQLNKLPDNTDKTYFLLHPIVKNHGMITVPSLGAQIINGQFVTKAQSTLVVQTPKLVLRDGHECKLVTEPSSVVNYLQSMDADSREGASVVSTNMPLQLMNAHIQGASDTSSPHRRPRPRPRPRPLTRAECDALSVADQAIQTLLSGKPYAENNVITRSIVIDEEETIDSVRERQSDGDSGKRKRDADCSIGGPPPPVKQRETDWEDKIPMDVISYMDATDPNSSATLNPVRSLGVITDVHSLARRSATDGDLPTSTTPETITRGNPRGETDSTAKAAPAVHRAVRAQVSPRYVHVNVFNTPRGQKATPPARAARADRGTDPDVIDLC